MWFQKYTVRERETLPMSPINIAVFIKQVPDNTKLQFNEIGPVLEGVSMMLNPYDEYALETALRLKEAGGEGSTLTVISQGASSAKEIVKKAIAVGADQAFLINDAQLEGTDSTGAAKVLNQAVKTLVPEAQVLIFGQASLDSASGQVGPKVAELMNAPSLTFCKNAELNGDKLTVHRESEAGIETHEMDLPAVICMMKCDYELRGSNIKGVMKANKTPIPEKSLADLGLDASTVAATTTITKTWKRPDKVGGKVIDGADAPAAVGQLLEYLKESKIL